MTATTTTRIAVLGQGMLGAAVLESPAAGDHSMTAYDLPAWDIRREADLERALDSVDAVINCAAYTDVDGAETDADTAHAVNADAVGRLGELAAARDVYVLHVSTDFVFDGRGDSPYTEDDAVNPVNAYGRSKLAGERTLAVSGCRHAIVRVEWTYGEHGPNFVSKILDLARARDEIRVVADQFGAPTPVTAAADALLAVCDRRAEGLYHYAAAGRASRFEVAEGIVAAAGLDCRVTPCDSSEFPSPAPRPANSVFDCSKFDRDIGAPRPQWRTALNRYLEACT